MQIAVVWPGCKAEGDLRECARSRGNWIITEAARSWFRWSMKFELGVCCRRLAKSMIGVLWSFPHHLLCWCHTQKSIDNYASRCLDPPPPRPPPPPPPRPQSGLSSMSGCVISLGFSVFTTVHTDCYFCSRIKRNPQNRKAEATSGLI